MVSAATPGSERIAPRSSRRYTVGITMCLAVLELMRVEAELDVVELIVGLVHGEQPSAEAFVHSAERFGASSPPDQLILDRLAQQVDGSKIRRLVCHEQRQPLHLVNLRGPPGVGRLEHTEGNEREGPDYLDFTAGTSGLAPVSGPPPPRHFATEDLHAPVHVTEVLFSSSKIATEPTQLTTPEDRALDIVEVSMTIVIPIDNMAAEDREMSRRMRPIHFLYAFEFLFSELMWGLIVQIVSSPLRCGFPGESLLQRVFAVDIMTCARRKGVMTLKKTTTNPGNIARALARRRRSRTTPAAATSAGPTRPAHANLRRLIDAAPTWAWSPRRASTPKRWARGGELSPEGR